MKSTSGFHTIQLTLLLFDDDTKQLMKDFYNYSHLTSNIIIIPNGDRTEIKFRGYD